MLTTYPVSTKDITPPLKLRPLPNILTPETTDAPAEAPTTLKRGNQAPAL